MDQEEKLQTESDEIDLMDYIKVLVKRKWLILIIFLAAVIVAGIFSFYSPKIYKIDTFLEIGRIGGQAIGVPMQMIEAPGQVMEKINNGVYGEYPGIKVNNPQNTSLITMEMLSKEPRKAKANLEEINNNILTEHTNKINLNKNILEKEIDELQENINFLISKEQETATLYLTIINLRKEIEALQPTKIVKSPTISEKPVKPRSALNIAVAGVLGIFIGIFLAFGKEWWEKNKARL